MDSLAEKVYYTLIGVLEDSFQISWVENAFAPNTECDRLYCEILQANERLCQRLGVPQEDTDVELLMDHFLKIQKELCLKMFSYGVKSENSHR